MGIDAEMFVRVPRKLDAETVHKTAVAMQIAFAGNDILNIRRPDPKAWMWKEGRQSLALVDVYEQDGPDIKPKRGESLVRVYLQSRFYGPGYERGDLIGILAVADYLKAAFSPCSVWYGGDSSGVLAQEIDQEYRAELWNHFCSSAARDYYGSMGRSIGHADDQVFCEFCQIVANNNMWGQGRSGHYCPSCRAHWLRYADGRVVPANDKYEPAEVSP